MWGHIRDYLDQASYLDYELFVRTPSGQVTQLDLEGIGVQARSYYSPVEQGEYVFWALRRPGTFTPQGGISTLSIQQAKAVYHHGEGSGTANDPVEILLEIVPEIDLTIFPGNEFKGIVLFEGSPAASAVISAYGPSGEVFEGTTSAEGRFELTLGSPGVWLITTNIATYEFGNSNGVNYGRVSRTSTLLFDNERSFAMHMQDSSIQLSDRLSIFGMILPFIIGILVGGAGILFFFKNN